MKVFRATCPACAGRDTRRVEEVWESQGAEVERLGADFRASLAPPVPRVAVTRVVRFYVLHGAVLIGWIALGMYLANWVQYRPEAVFSSYAVAVIGAGLQFAWLLGHGPEQTADQAAALREWAIAHARWERSWVCFRCRKTFVP